MTNAFRAIPSCLVGLAVALLASAALAQTAPPPPPTPPPEPLSAPPPPPVDFPQPPPGPPPPVPPPEYAPPPQPLPPPAAAPLAFPPAEPPRRSAVSSWAGIGLANYSTDSSGVGLGLALEGGGEYRFNETIGLGLRFGWGLTAWDRTAALLGLGTAAGSWTAGAYRDVTTWLVTGDPKWALLKFMGSIFAYTFLTVGFVFAGLCYLFAPFAATSFLSLAVPVSMHLDLAPDVELWLEGGPATMIFWHPRTGSLHTGFGPSLGLGFRLQRTAVTATATWIPPALQPTSGQQLGALAATVTVRRVW